MYLFTLFTPAVRESRFCVTAYQISHVHKHLALTVLHINPYLNRILTLKYDSRWHPRQDVLFSNWVSHQASPYSMVYCLQCSNRRIMMTAVESDGRCSFLCQYSVEFWRPPVMVTDSVRLHRPAQVLVCHSERSDLLHAVRLTVAQQHSVNCEKCEIDSNVEPNCNWTSAKIKNLI